MFAADAEFQIGPGLAATLCRQFHQLANAFNIKADKRIARIDALLHIGVQEARGVVA